MKVDNSNIDFLNEISKLNNEIINAQRSLIRQNAEVARLNKHLAEANIELEQFSYVASHDLKEPLRMITSFLKLLKNKYGSQLEEKAKTYIDFALDGGIRMERMINDLLEFSRLGHGNHPRTTSDFAMIVNEVQNNLSQLIEDRRAQIKINTVLPVMRVYHSEISRLFQNLLTNAIKFSKQGIDPEINIAAEERKAEWLMSVSDNGMGIQNDKLEKVFEMFSRINPGREIEGTGIGLAVCKKIVQHHDGEIWIESEEGKGTTFFFTLAKI